MLAMVVNDNACELNKRGALESIASKPAPTVSRECMKNLFFGAFTGLEVTSFSAWVWSLVGAALLAMVVNDNACQLNKRGALESIASKPAPTVSREGVKNLFLGLSLAWRSLHFPRGYCPL
ncbi:hypothetical protein [Pseudomonas sp. A-R-19]|uniref:hypothetical protein n=1 Tax=Pseudomonas sp. A-R-19 TaxID=2832403 RepID=UPI001CC1AE7F|nr:hypothetical protein [Pseudomonas sp. A-R-19]